MTLTEQWKKGELEFGAYYVTYYKNDTPEVDIYRRVYSLYDDSEVRFTIPQVDKVLAPVPSYDRFCRLNHLENDFIKAHERINELEKENTQLIKWCEKFNALDVAKENQHLKELLLQIRNRQSLIREYLSDVKLGNAWDLLCQTENEITNAIGEKK